MLDWLGLKQRIDDEALLSVEVTDVFSNGLFGAVDLLTDDALAI